MLTPGIAYTIGTGKLCCKIDDFHAEAERLLGRSIFTHEFGEGDTWKQLRTALEAEFMKELR